MIPMTIHLQKSFSMLLLVLGLLGCVLPAAPVNHVYILTGQSNSLGAVKGSPASPEQLEKYSSKGMLWNGNMVRDTGERFVQHPSWSQVAPQEPAYPAGSANLCMGPEYGFCSMMQRRGWHSGGDRKLCVIKASLDGGGNSCWSEGSPGYTSLSQTVRKALGELKGKTRVHALLYLQGESNRGVEITETQQRFLDLLSRVAKDTKKGPKMAVVGQCATWNGTENKDDAGHTSAELMEELARKKKNIGFVRTRDLTKITSGDLLGVHYDGISQITIGARYAYAIAVLEKLPMGSVRNDNPAASLESPAAWWGGKVPTPETVATWDISALRGEHALGKSLAVSGLLVEDATGGKVKIVAQEGARPQLVLGSDGIRLQEADLELLCDVHLSAQQTWKLHEGRKLVLGSPQNPIALSGPGPVAIRGARDASVIIYLKSGSSADAVKAAPDGPALEVRSTE